MGVTNNGHVKGFRLPERTGRLVFEGDYAGAEVVVRLDVPLGMFFDLAELKESDPAEVRTALLDFSRDVLREWNIEDAAGEIVPVKPDGMLRVSTEFAMLIMEVWAEAMTKSPLAQRRSRPLTSSANGGARPRARSSRRKAGSSSR